MLFFNEVYVLLSSRNLGFYLLLLTCSSHLGQKLIEKTPDNLTLFSLKAFLFTNYMKPRKKKFHLRGRVQGLTLVPTAISQIYLLQP